MTRSDTFKQLTITSINEKHASIRLTTKILRMSRSTYYNWRRNYGPAVQKKYHVKLTESVKDKIEKYALEKRFCSVYQIRKYLMNFGIFLGKSSVYSALKERKIVKNKCKKEEYVKTEEKKKNDIEYLKKVLNNIPMDRILSYDESGFNNNEKTLYCWCKKGEVVTIPSTLKYTRTNLMLTVSINGCVMAQKTRKKVNQDIFLQYLKKLKTCLKKGKIHYLFMDNALFHKTKKIKEFFSSTPNLIPIFNASYSPEYNPIEIIFGLMKRHFKKENEINKSHQFTCNLIEKSLSLIKKDTFLNCFTKCLGQFVAPAAVS
jgi:transposase